jgi:hypothetical protein
LDAVTGLLARPLQPQIIDNQIPAPIFQRLLEAAPRIPWHFGWTSPSNKAARYWHHEIGYGQKENTVCIRANIDRHPVKTFAHYVDWLRNELVGSSVLLRYYLNAHTYGVDGSPHTDSDRPGEVTIVTYLTSVWHPVWAGGTVIYGEESAITLSALPRANRLVLFPSDLLHGPEPLSRFFNGLRIVLVAKFRLE